MTHPWSTRDPARFQLQFHDFSKTFLLWLFFITHPGLENYTKKKCHAASRFSRRVGTLAQVQGFWGKLTAEVLVFRRKHKGLRNNVEVFKAVSLLHSLDVFVQAIFARQFIWPGKQTRPVDLWVKETFQALYSALAERGVKHSANTVAMRLPSPWHYDSFHVLKRHGSKLNALYSGSQQTHWRIWRS